MLISTKGIVIGSVKYSETSLIVRIFTRELGLQSYIIKGIRSKKSGHKAALFQPLQMLEMTVYNRENKKINHVKELKPAYVYQTISFDPVKRSVAIFITEILNRSLKENLPDKALSEWLWQTLTWYDLSNEKTTDFHIIFLIQLTKFLGFFPKYSEPGNIRSFDLMEGVFGNNEPVHPHYISGEDAILFYKMLNFSFNDISSISISSNERSRLLDILIEYYRLHIENFGEVKSLDVLRMLFD